MQGTTIIRVRSKDDIDEMWSEIQKSKNTSCLWCDGLVDNRTGKKWKLFSDGEESKSKTRKKHHEKDEDVQRVVDTLKTKVYCNASLHLG